jgi:hypothetical protein
LLYSDGLTLSSVPSVDKIQSLRRGFREQYHCARTSDYEKEAFQSRAFFMKGFIALKQDLIRKLDAKAFRAVLDTYIKIEHLRYPSDSKESNKREYKETIDIIKKAIELLK